MAKFIIEVSNEYIHQRADFNKVASENNNGGGVVVLSNQW